MVEFASVATGRYVLSPSLKLFSEVNSPIDSVESSRLVFETYTRYSSTNESTLGVQETRRGLVSVLASRSRSWTFVTLSGAVG